ncbi:MAG: hypothetical protein QOF22_241 [Bradyrhizobium sp.]|jgi:hypothetical protein|nr:hypothetical protein [Bradyrhizobium sp.]
MVEIGARSAVIAAPLAVFARLPTRAITACRAPAGRRHHRHRRYDGHRNWVTISAPRIFGSRADVKISLSRSFAIERLRTLTR